MKIHFHQPPEAQRIGGLDAAIQSLERALVGAGHCVEIDPSNVPGNAEIAHFHGLWQPRFRKLAATYREHRVPYIVSPHGMLERWAFRHKWWKKLPYWHLVERPWIKRAASVLTTAGSERLRLTSFLPHTRVDVLPLGMTDEQRPDYGNARAVLGWKADDFVLLFLSRIHPKKGLDLLLRALTRLPSDTLRAMRLVVVGPEEDAGYAQTCRTFAEAHRHELPTVDWLGAVWGDARWSYLQGADLLCLPSHSENFGLVVLEACQVGTPVLTSDQTPWPAHLLPHRGHIAAPQVESLAASLLKILSQKQITPEARQALSAWAFANFAWSTLAARYSHLYSDLVRAES